MTTCLLVGHNRGMTERIPALIPLPDHPYYLWQTLAQCVNLPRHDVDPVFLVYGTGSSPRPSALLERVMAETSHEARWHFFPDDRPEDERTYNAAMKPRLVGRHLSEHRESVNRRHLILDPDVLVIREPVEGWESIPSQSASLTDSYAGSRYLAEKGALGYLCSLVGLKPTAFVGAGAQYLIQGLPSGFWHEVARLSKKSYREMTDNAEKYRGTADPDYAVQAWCAEMYMTQLLSMAIGWPFTPDPHMEFIWADSPAREWQRPGVTFFHDAGVPEPNGRDFCKIEHQVAPWGDDGTLVLSSGAVSRESASWHYVASLREVTGRYPSLCEGWHDLAASV